MTKYFLVISLLFYLPSFAQNDDLILEGTIGKYPVAFEINKDAGNPYAIYFYKSAKKDIQLKGSFVNGAYTFVSVQWNSKNQRDDSAETFMLKQGADKKWSGTWKNNKGQTYDVALSPVNVDTISNPYSNLPVVKKMQKEDHLGYLRTSMINIVDDSVKQNGKYKVQFCHADKTQIYIFKIVDGLEVAIMDSVNNVLINSLMEHAENYLSCTSSSGNGYYQYTITHTYFTDNIISINREVAWDCGGAHPDDGNDPININTKTGKEFILDDLLHFVTHPIPDEKSDNWTTYRDKEFAPKLVKLLTKLYPAKMKKIPGKDCDYSQKDCWTFVNWYFTDKGLLLLPDFSHVDGACNDVNWSIIPYSILNKQVNPKLKISLP